MQPDYPPGYPGRYAAQGLGNSLPMCGVSRKKTVWDELPKCRRRMFLAMAGIIPITTISFVSVLSVMQLFDADKAGPVAAIVSVAVMLVGGTLYLISFLQLLLWRCPNCHRRYFGRLPFYDASWVFNQTCFYCNHGPNFTSRSSHSAGTDSVSPTGLEVSVDCTDSTAGEGKIRGFISAEHADEPQPFGLCEFP